MGIARDLTVDEPMAPPSSESPGLALWETLTDRVPRQAPKGRPLERERIACRKDIRPLSRSRKMPDSELSPEAS